LDTTVGHAISSISKAEGLLVDGVLVISDGDSDDREVGSSSAGREEPALLAGIVLGSWNSSVDSLDKGVVNQAQGGASVHDGGVVVALNLLAVDVGRCGWDVPEALRIVDWSVVDGLAVGDGRVDEAESVEALFTALFGGQVGCEQLRVLGAVEACQQRRYIQSE
jgi:hypothetical protein